MHAACGMIQWNYKFPKPEQSTKLFDYRKGIIQIPTVPT